MGLRDSYQDAARRIGLILAESKVDLAYGGGCVGLMGILADASLQNGGRVIGVIPEHLAAKEIAHTGLTELRTVASMHERKALMAELADAFVALPGGYGTFEEFCEMLTWSQLGLHRKPCGLLNVDHFYDGLLQMFDHAVHEGFVNPVFRELVVDENDPALLLKRLEEYQPPSVVKWVGPGQT